MDYLEKMKEKVQGFQEELDDLQNKVVSGIKNNETVKKIKKEAQQIKKELEKDFDKLKKWTKKEVMKLRNSLNDMINWTSKKPEKNTENKEIAESSTVTNAAIEYMKSKSKFKIMGMEFDLLNKKTEQKVREILNDYLKKYPLLKKNTDGKIQLEIWNKTEFAKMVSNLRTTIINSMNSFMRKGFEQTDVYKKANNILSDINKSLPNLDANDYKSIVFSYIWWVVKEAVKTEWWKMTLEDYYNDISRYYPNKNANQVSKDLAESGWAKYNIDEAKWYA